MSYFGTIYADTELPSRAMAVYMYLRDRSDGEGKCWPGIKTIASDMKLSRSTDHSRRTGSLPLHGQAGAARSGAARISEKGFPPKTEREQHLQSLYCEITKSGLYQNVVQTTF